MPQLATQFEEAKRSAPPTSIDVCNASNAHSQVRKALERSEELAITGIDTILIGSYARHIAVRRIEDVDVHLRLADIDWTVAPAQLLAQFRDVLASEFGASLVELQDRSVKVEFPNFELSVDAVPARPHLSHWEVPDRHGGWEETNPERLGSLTTEMNDYRHGHYVPTVKLIRQARRTQLGDRKLGGLYVEISCYCAFARGVTADSASEKYGPRISARLAGGNRFSSEK